MATFFSLFVSPVNNYCAKGNNDISIKGDVFPPLVQCLAPKATNVAIGALLLQHWYIVGSRLSVVFYQEDNCLLAFPVRYLP